MIHLYPLLPQELTEQDVAWLARLGAAGYNKRTAVDIVKEVMQGHCAIWRIGGHAKGVVITRLIKGNDERTELHLDGFTGTGIATHARQVLACLRRLAERAGAARICATPDRPEVYKLYDRMGAREVARVYEIGVG